MRALLFLALLCAGLWTGARQDGAPIVGAGEHRYRWVEDWPKAPIELGSTHGCVVVDREDRVYVCTDTERAVLVFDRDGALVRAFGRELAGGLHGLVIREEDGVEFLYAAHLGRREVLKLTLEGEILWTIGYPEESGLYDDPARFLPTSVAVAPDGSIYVADGYGLSWIHVFGPDRVYQRTLGGLGVLRGQFRTPHGLSIAAWDGEPALIVADRENHRLQVLALDGRVLAVLADELRRPCHAHLQGDELLIADLAGRVTILDRAGRALAQIADQPEESLRARNDVPRELWKDGELLAPHCAARDSRGDLYVAEWSALGRVVKLEKLP